MKYLALGASVIASAGLGDMCTYWFKCERSTHMGHSSLELQLSGTPLSNLCDWCDDFLLL